MVSAEALFGDGRMRGMLLILLYVSHSSARCGIQNTAIMETSEEGLVRSKEFPWVVSLQDSQYTHLAFGSILSEFWILSIASAFQNRKDAIAIVGIAKMDAKVVSHEEYPINIILLHEEFENHTMSNNIALLKTDTAMQFDDLVQPICFLNKKLLMQQVLRNCWVAGWNPTSATGNHMTMSILRKISVKDVDLCPLHRIQKSGCGNHIQQETDAVCLGDAGNPMMCQLPQLNLWMLKGILTHGGQKCPGIFLYVRVEDYSEWIVSKTKTSNPLLSSFHHWDNLIPLSSYSPQVAVTQKRNSGLSQVGKFQTNLQGQKRATKHLWPANDSRMNLDFRENNGKESSRASEVAIQPMYYDYYGGDVGDGGSMSGQNSLHQPPEIILFFFVLVFFCRGI
ncbi:LOW QUALITY PROTEIN: inactive serine protease 54 [Erinaceus europaeus]|uniref:LOW QUALITY PROTEIN: inactive serine protease 54 n=1 Tax=Erinaceus europaeus TaxID=9365 RepID=A0ABM3WXZ4_ERIEU|nr:LOW QUALITY PROTEIN: inactive serine protease 54 [Erinaceus europaeus]